MICKSAYLISEMIMCFSCTEIKKSHALVHLQIKKDVTCKSYLN